MAHEPRAMSTAAGRLAALELLLWALVAPLAGADDGLRPFAIEVVDQATGRGVPLVELRTTNDIRLVTDSHGLVAFLEPGLMGQRVFFHVRSHGYEFPKDGFGYRGKALEASPGGRARIEIRRLNIAERLYRTTGAGIYRDSVLVGDAVPLRHPVLNAQVTGSDSVLSAVFRGRIYWFWGDTNRPSYPLGNFHTPGATSRLPSDGGLDPSVGVDLEYFAEPGGFARPTAKLPGEGPTWMSGLVVLRDASGKERMFAHYTKIRGLPGGGFESYEQGLAEFDDGAKRFTKTVAFADETRFPHGAHPFVREVDGRSYVYYCDPYPYCRVLATPESLARQEDYEVFTCLASGTTEREPQFDRDPAGKPRYRWKRNTRLVFPREMAAWVRAGKLSAADDPMALRDAESGKAVIAHRGSVYWNAYRQRWVMIAGETHGTSMLGECWFAEADDPLGPWVWARKIITHDRYSFYNPKQHPMLDQAAGRLIYLEGTYTTSFSGNDDKTPRYDYNQVMYRLDLADPRLVLPVPVYGAGSPPSAEGLHVGRRADDALESIVFFAQDRPSGDNLPVYVVRSERGAATLRVGGRAAGEPVFFVLAADVDPSPATTVPLFELLGPDGRRGYAAGESVPAPPGFRRQLAPVGRVWPHPLRAGLLSGR